MINTNETGNELSVHLAYGTRSLQVFFAEPYMGHSRIRYSGSKILARLVWLRVTRVKMVKVAPIIRTLIQG